MLKRYILIAIVLMLLSLSACDKDGDIILPENGGETQLFDLPDTWENVSEVVPTYDNLLLFNELITTEEHYWDNYVSTYNLETGETNRLFYALGGASVSPNGQRMIYIRDWFDVHLTTYPPSEDDVRLDVEGLNAGQWVDDAHIIYGKLGSQSSDLWMLNVDTLEERRLTVEPNYREYGGSTVISPDRKLWILTESYRADWDIIFRVYLYGWDGENLTFVRSLFDHSDGMYKLGTWSPDGTKLIIMGNRTDDPEWDGTTDRAIFVYDINNGNFTQLTFTDYKDEGGPQLGCWSADGKTIYFSTRERIFELDARKLYQ